MKAFLEEFKAFIMRGNVMDMAVGVIIGGAFTAIVNSLVNNIIQPMIAYLTGGGAKIDGLVVPGTAIDVGAFLSAVINFLIVAFIVFLMVKAISKLQNKGKDLGQDLGIVAAQEAPKVPHCPLCIETVAQEAQFCPHCAQDIRALDKLMK